MKHAGTKTIETTRLVMRRLELTDAEMMFRNWKNGEMIGSIGVTITSEYDFKGSLGYKIGSRWWNQGYSSEAAEAVIDYMFRNTDIERMDAFASVENAASGKVMEKTGMRYEGLLRHYYKIRDGFHDCTLYGIIRDDWEQEYICKS